MLNEPFSVALIWIAWILLGSYLTVSKGHMGSVRNLGFLGMLCFLFLVLERLCLYVKCWLLEFGIFSCIY